MSDPISRAKSNLASLPRQVTLPGAGVDLDDTSFYFNRELSWIQFDARVMEEALDQRNPLLERLRFLSIFYTNLDEFFMVRVSGLRRQLEAGVVETPPDGMMPSEQLAAIRSDLRPLLERGMRCWREQLQPELAAAGVGVVPYDELFERQRAFLRRHFEEQIFPVLTPLAFDPSHPFPHISNLSMNLAVVVRDPDQGELFARVKVPQSIPRLVRVPSRTSEARFRMLGLKEEQEPTFVFLEEVVLANLDLLFPGVEVAAAYPFRVTRDAEFEIEEDEAADLLTAMAEVVEQRYFGSVVRLEIDAKMPERIRDILTENLGLAPYQVFTASGPLGLSALGQLAEIDRPDLKFTPFLPVVQPALAVDEPLVSVIRRRDVLLCHPYDSFNSVVRFLREAAEDPDVLAIKVTLYRVGENSPIVEQLMEARENGKQVCALVELKARFDEKNNIVWAKALERAGVHVVYGVLGLKTHAKVCLVVRRERGGIARYVHVGTGNYNPVTAKVYTDLGLLTADPEIASDVSNLFNSLTGYSREPSYSKLLVAPGAMRTQLLERIEREIACHQRCGDGHLIFKLNGLVDRKCIQALYRASQAGVQVDLQVRGICCLRPGVAGISANIAVTSIVGRFLEHSRIYYFHNGGDEEMLIGSADLMPRNLDGRVEVLAPVEDPRLLRAIRDDILYLHLCDTVKSRRLSTDGTYTRQTVRSQEDVARGEGDTREVNSQETLVRRGGGWRVDD